MCIFELCELYAFIYYRPIEDFKKQTELPYPNVCVCDCGVGLGGIG